MWSDGLSGSAIASEFGKVGIPITRSAIIGKAHRLGLESRIERKTTLIREPARKSERRPTLNVGRVIAMKKQPTEQTFDGQPITLMDLTNATCRWPVNDDVRNMLYCGKPTADLAGGCPYCSHHSAIAFPPRSKP
jgi:hypothetical protein